MSEKAVTRTEVLLKEVVPAVFSPGLDSVSRWQAVEEISVKSQEISALDLISEEVIRDFAQHNARNYAVDTVAADSVIHGQSKVSDDEPQMSLWRGTGTSISFVDGKVVHYFNKPGIVEAKYGPGFPYIMQKAAWAAFLQLDTGVDLNSSEGYQSITKILRQHGRLGETAVPHIGAACQRFSPRSDAETYVTSSSGILPTDQLHESFAHHGFAQREAADQNLLDGFEENLRAGLYDVVFSRLVMEALVRVPAEDVFQVPDPELYKDMDIN